MELHGLNDLEVKKSREAYGSNEIPDSEPTTFWKEFKETFKDPMIRVLLAISALMIVMFFLGYAEIFEPAGTLVAILIVATVTAKTGVASDTKYRNLKHSVKEEEIKVYRNGNICNTGINQIVTGDLVLLQAGDKIPADGILITGHLNVNNAALNGEAEECPKTAAASDTPFPDEITGDTFVDESSLFRGAIVFDGEGVMLVKKVGIKTMMGRMALEMQEEEPPSPLQVKLSILAGQISKIGYIGAILIALFYVIHFVSMAGGVEPYLNMGWEYILMDLIDAVTIAIVIIVCAVPEGLPLMISIVLMQNTSKMLDHNVLVRKAEGIETAGALNILFSDKTGTITKGELEVVEFFTADGLVIPFEELKKYPEVRNNLRIAIGQNSSSMYDERHRVIGGNATDQALMKFLGEDSYQELQNDESLHVVNAQKFNSANKFSQAQIGSRTYYKGAPERLLQKATHYLSVDGQIRPLDTIRLNEKIDQLASKAMRVLSFGYSDHPMEEDVIEDGLVLIGLTAIRDDVRPEARTAIREVQEAGIQVVMITGDRLETAAAIAADAGLVTSEEDICLTSSELNSMSDDRVKQILSRIRVIARALPTDKSRMVRICQELNLVVGMTGDGVNDSPALKRADVGFAMGSGTEAAKEAGKIVILDDNFNSIKDAIWYGRTIYHNILKFCKFQLVVNVAAVLVSAVAPFLGVEEPLKVTHLLFVNLVMDGLGAMMLGNEPALEAYMKEKPRRRDESLVSREMMTQIGIMGIWLTLMSLFYLMSDWARSFFETDAQFMTSYFVLFIASALFNGFNVRNDGFAIFKNLKDNPDFLKVMCMILGIQFCLVNISLIPAAPAVWIGNMFSCVPFGVSGWVLVLILAFTMIPVDMIRKIIFRKLGNK
mgnify:CR=1 FL=1